MIFRIIERSPTQTRGEEMSQEKIKGPRRIVFSHSQKVHPINEYLSMSYPKCFCGEWMRRTHGGVSDLLCRNCYKKQTSDIFRSRWPKSLNNRSRRVINQTLTTEAYEKFFTALLKEVLHNLRSAYRIGWMKRNIDEYNKALRVWKRQGGEYLVTKKTLRLVNRRGN